jgi:hypothetical protein
MKLNGSGKAKKPIEQRIGLVGVQRCLAVALMLSPLVLAGCSKAIGKPLHGSVSCKGQSVPTGKVSFCPVGDASRPIYSAPILDGQYRIAAQDGVRFGKYRVQVDARKKTGRQVQGGNGREVVMIDETVLMVPEVYANEKSPLTIDLQPSSSESFNIEIP